MVEAVYAQPGWRRGGPKQVQAVNTAIPLADAAAEYEERMLREFGGRPGALPRFDAILLGLGDDGHTASLFPGSPLLAIDVTRDVSVSEYAVRTLAGATGRAVGPRGAYKLVLPVFNAPKAPSMRVTFSISLINCANNVSPHFLAATICICC